MPKKGDYFVSVLKETHIGWGVYRKTESRKRIDGEAYIKIPSEDAKRIGIYNSNAGEGLGVNIFHCKSADGFLNADIKMAGSSTSNDIYAKNLQGCGDLKIIGRWFESVNAQVGDRVLVKWISDIDITIELMQKT